MIRMCIDRFNCMLRSCARISRLFSVTRSVGDIELTQFDGGFMKVLLNRPKALNSLNLPMIEDLDRETPSIAANKAFWMEGAGGKAFCAGGDVKNLFQEGATAEDRLKFFRSQFQLDYHMSQLKSIQIANWDGIVMGGGFGVSAHAPFIIATENTMFAMPEAKLGFFTDVASSYLLSRLRSNIGYYLGLTGSRLKGDQVYVAGLANYFIKRENLELAFRDLRDTLPNVEGDIKHHVHVTLSRYHDPPKTASLENEGQINEIFGLDSVQKIERRLIQDKSIHGQGLLKAMHEQCPLSLGIIHRLITSAKSKNLKECFQQDFYLVQKAIHDPNFAEGVRTVLVDRKAKPVWSHKTIQEVTEKDVENYFTFPSSLEKLEI